MSNLLLGTAKLHYLCMTFSVLDVVLIYPSVLLCATLFLHSTTNYQYCIKQKIHIHLPPSALHRGFFL